MTWFLNRMHEFRNLLSLLMMEPTKYKRVDLQFGSHLLPGARRMLKDYASLLFKQPWAEAEVRELHSFRIPLNYSALRRAFPDLLTTWYERYGELKPVFDMFFLPTYLQDLNIEFQFLALLQALEALHRRTIGGAYMSKAAYEGTCGLLVSCIPATLSGDHRAALAKRMEYGYEYSLRKRLGQVASVLGKDVMLKMTNGERLRCFLDRVVVTRNYLTHLDESLKDDSMEPKEMIRANRALTLFLMVLILHEIGVPVDLVVEQLMDRGLFRLPEFLDPVMLP